MVKSGWVLPPVDLEKSFHFSDVCDFGDVCGLRPCSSALPPKILSGGISIPVSQVRKLGLRQGQ